MKPISNAPTSPLTFEQRLPLVRAEVTARVMSSPAEKRNATRARLWVSWIKRNVLEVK